MALAQRLNELAIANSQGLLNDDEYRLLRQNVFEQYSANATPPVETPLVPIARVEVKIRTTAPPSPSSHKSPPPPPSPVPRTRSLGVASLLRMATGRRTPAPAPPPIHVPKKAGPSGTRPLLPADPAPPTPTTPKRSALLPRILHKKPSDSPPQRTPSSSRHPPPVLTHTHASYHAITYPAPASPSSSNFSGSLLSHTYPDKHPAAVRDVFAEDNLISAADIRAAIAAAENEAARLAAAFASLEATAVRRLHKQRARRLPAAPPASVAVLLEGREWRVHRRPTPDPGTRSDAASVRSAASARTSLSQARSVPAFPRGQAHGQHPASPLAPTHARAPPLLLRKASVSSVSSSRAPSLAPSAGTIPPPLSLLARSTSHLGLRRLARSARAASTDTLGAAPGSAGGAAAAADLDEEELGGEDGADDDVELVDIRRRREALGARYAARIEFLRAKLRGAELHEKLLRK